MARSSAAKKAEDERLVERYIDLEWDRYPGGRADARLRDSGVSVWAIVAYLRVYDNDADQVANHFDLSREEMDGALAYYRLNKPYIDARILLNEA
jgi:uncharacterized protein (DUF433 family)